MRSRSSPFLCLPLLALCLAYLVGAQRYLEVPWSDTKYGPDGPWQAVKVTVGGNDTSKKIVDQNHADLDMFPGGSYTAFTFTKKACDPYPHSICGAGGTWDPDAAAKNLYPSFSQPVLDDSYGLKAGPFHQVARALTIRDSTVWNVTMTSSDQGNVTYFNGSIGPLTLGYLPLGADAYVQTFQLSGVGDNLTLNVYNGALRTNGRVGSFSFSLHIGSAAFDYPGSLVFGGYNKGRIIGPLTSWRAPAWDQVDLLDIGIGVEYGASPFNFTKKQNLLVSDTGAIGKKLPVNIDSRTPYLSLPDNTCEGLASLLPVKFDEKTKYYLWQTEDPKYKDIVTSPSYLSFTFPPGPGAAENVTIKVPFALLNLTLDTPIVDKPTQYFPCHAFTPKAGYHHRLGRAFLQAAFWGRNWDQGISWLAQAPGPGANGEGLGDELKDIPMDATTLVSWGGDGRNYFNQSWASHWYVQKSAETQAPGVSTSPAAASGLSTGLNAGAKAGIGIGVAVAVLLMGGVAVLAWRKGTRERGERERQEDLGDGKGELEKWPRDRPAQELNGVVVVTDAPQELNADLEVQEAPDN